MKKEKDITECTREEFLEMMAEYEAQQPTKRVYDILTWYGDGTTTKSKFFGSWRQLESHLKAVKDQFPNGIVFKGDTGEIMKLWLNEETPRD